MIERLSDLIDIEESYVGEYSYPYRRSVGALGSLSPLALGTSTDSSVRVIKPIPKTSIISLLITHYGVKW